MIFSFFLLLLLLPNAATLRWISNDLPTLQFAWFAHSFACDFLSVCVKWFWFLHQPDNERYVATRVALTHPNQMCICCSPFKITHNRHIKTILQSDINIDACDYLKWKWFNSIINHTHSHTRYNVHGACTAMHTLGSNMKFVWRTQVQMRQSQWSQ